MKNKFQKLGAFAFAAMTIVGFASCGGDDDNGGGFAAGGSSTQAGVVSPELPKRLTAVLGEDRYDPNSYYYNYLPDGRLDNMTIKYGNYGRDSLILNPATNQYVLKVYTSNNRLEQEVPFPLSFNANGYISGISASVTEQEDGMTVTYNSTVYYQYDAEGRFTGNVAQTAGQGWFTEDGLQYIVNMQYSGKNTFTWEDGKLMVAKSEGTTAYSIPGYPNEYYSEGQTVNFYYEQEYPNRYCQYGPFIDKFDSELDVTGVFNVGFYGRGPAMLPSSYESKSYESDDNGGEIEEHLDGRGTFQYRFNEDGTIAWMKVGSESYSFVYEDLTANAAKARNFVMAPEAENSTALKSDKKKSAMMRCLEKIRANGMAK